jgi:nucleoside-diphosphate-sugar epimerase
MSIFITGAAGFVGTNLRRFIGNKYSIVNYKKGAPIFIQENVVIHLAGKAHDLKNLSTPDEYYEVNTELTKDIFNVFLASNAKVFITLSSVKAVADESDEELLEEVIPNPVTHYGKSKLLAEQYILSFPIPEGKRVYILRPCMIHGPGNKGNLNLLVKFVSKGIPWPLGAFVNKRSFCSIDNLLFIIKELIEREDIPSGIYNVADDLPLSTNEVVEIIASLLPKQTISINLNKKFIEIVCYIGDLLNLPINTDRLNKLTSNFIVSNRKITKALGMPLPLISKEGIIKTIKSFI